MVSQCHCDRMVEHSVMDGHPDPVIHHILRRLDRVERRLRALEREKKICHGPLQHYDTFSHKLSECVSIIGVKEAVSARHYGLKFSWLLFFVVCLGCMGFFVSETMKEYLDEPTATKVKLVEQKHYDYPSILLCPDTWLDAEKALTDGLSTGGLQYALGYLINYFGTPPPYRIQDYDRAQSDFEYFYNRRKFTDLVEFFKYVSLDSEEFFYQCPFCRNQSFEKVIMGDAVCYQVPMQATPGNAPVVSSLDTLEVVVPDRSRGLLRRRAFWRLYLGLDLLLGEATRRHAEIYPHQMNTIQFVTHKFVSVDTPDNPCIKQANAPSNYSFARCVLKCYIEHFYGDQPFLMTACSSSRTNCDNSGLQPNRTFQFYTNDLWEQLASNDGSSKEEEAPEYCYARCPSFCERRIYTIDVQSHAITPIVDLSYNGQNPISDQNSTGPPPPSRPGRGVSTPPNLTRLSFLNTAAVYGGVLTFEEVSTYSFHTMVGNVGGMLSLWMGISIMSLIQVLMFFLTNWLPRRKLQSICKRSSTCDSTLSPPMIRNSPVMGALYCRTNAHRSSSVV